MTDPAACAPAEGDDPAACAPAEGDDVVGRPRPGHARALAALVALVLGGTLLAGACAPIGDPESAGIEVQAGAEPTTPADAEAVEDAVADNPLLLLDPGQPDERNVTIYRGPQLPVPESLPEDAYEQTPEQTIGGLRIPALGIDEALHVGMTLTAINRGPSMWPGTAVPGEVGNTVIAGHRTTFGAPFRHLDTLQPGDQVFITTDTGEHVYEVERTEVVDDEATYIAAQSNEFTATLFACHPPGSAAQRIVAHLDLLGPDGSPLPPARVSS